MGSDPVVAGVVPKQTHGQRRAVHVGAHPPQAFFDRRIGAIANTAIGPFDMAARARADMGPEQYPQSDTGKPPPTVSRPAPSSPLRSPQCRTGQYLYRQILQNISGAGGQEVRLNRGFPWCGLLVLACSGCGVRSNQSGKCAAGCTKCLAEVEPRLHHDSTSCPPSLASVLLRR